MSFRRQPYTLLSFCMLMSPRYSVQCHTLPALPDKHNLLINAWELIRVDDWLVANRLYLNVNKIKYMIFHNSRKDISNFSFNIILNHGEIEKISTFNFLGIITLDENIDWKPHIETVACKLPKYCGVLSKQKKKKTSYHFISDIVLL